MRCGFYVKFLGKLSVFSRHSGTFCSLRPIWPSELLSHVLNSQGKARLGCFINRLVVYKRYKILKIENDERFLLGPMHFVWAGIWLVRKKTRLCICYLAMLAFPSRTSYVEIRESDLGKHKDNEAILGQEPCLSVSKLWSEAETLR